MTGQGGTPVTLPTTTLKSLFKKSSLYVTLPVSSVNTEFLADSGAEISVIPSSHPAIPVDRVLKPIRLQPVMADGKPLDVKGIITLPVLINDMSFDIDFYVVDSRVKAILGLDVMKRFHEVNLNFEDHTVTFGTPLSLGRVDHNVEGEGAPRCCQIVLASDSVIPARHETTIAGMLKVEDPSLLSTFADQPCLFESRLPSSSGLGGARVLGVVQEGYFPVRIVNPLQTEVKLKSLSTLGVVTILEKNPVVSVLGDDDDVCDVLAPPSNNGKVRDLMDQMVAGAEVSSSEKDRLRLLLKENEAAFSWEGELGCCADLPFKIDTGNARPVRQMPRRVPHHLKREVDSQIDSMLEKGVLEPSVSEWASPVCLVRKPDGSLRFCVDYRKVNAVSKHDAFPLPNISDCLSSAGGYYRYTLMDMLSGYWQVLMDKESQEKAAITTHRGLFQPTVLPFGVRGGVAHFSRLMSSLFSDLQWKVLLIYLDDLLVFSRTFEEHLERLQLVFKVLIKAGLKLKPSKCQLLRRSVKFLGHHISEEGVSTDRDKVAAVIDFPVPKDVDRVRSFLGMAGYYRDFVPRFADVAKPLTELTKKGKEFAWTASCTQAFESLKAALVSAPVLAYPDFSKQFIVTTDASDVGLGAVLSQDYNGRERVISYASRSLTSAEVNYCTTEKECLAVVWATEYFSHYLLGAEEFVIRTDHDPLTYLRSIPNPRGRLARWISLLEQYPYRITYMPGKQIPHADALSRSGRVAEIELPVDIPREQLLDQQKSDVVLQRVLELKAAGQTCGKGESKEIQQLLKVAGGFVSHEGVLGVFNKSKFQVIVPRSLVPLVLKLAHDDVGHHQADRVLSSIRERFYWGTLFNDVTNWCRSCEECQGRNHPGVKSKAPLQFMPVPAAPWQDIAIDYVGPLVETVDGNRSILVITDRLSKYTLNVAVPDQTARTTADVLFLQVFAVHSFPLSIHSDQGKNFESELIARLCELAGIHKTRTSGYHPQCNGLVERYNQTMIGMLSKYIAPGQDDWDKHLPLVAFFYNTSVHSITGFKPFELHFGRSPRVRLDMFASTPVTTKAKEAGEWLREMQQKVKKLTNQAQETIKRSQVIQKDQYGEDSRYVPFRKGDLVMCREYACKRGLKPKLVREKWSGPWKVTLVRGPVNYRIVRGKKKLLVHHNRLKSYVERDHSLVTPPVDEEVDLSLSNGPVADRPLPLDSDSDSEEEIEDDNVPNQIVDLQPVVNDREPVRVDVDVRPNPLMGPQGRQWCNLNQDNIIAGKRGNRN